MSEYEIQLRIISLQACTRICACGRPHACMGPHGPGFTLDPPCFHSKNMVVQAAGLCCSGCYLFKVACLPLFEYTSHYLACLFNCHPWMYQLLAVH